MGNDECSKAFGKIVGTANKLQTICKLAVDPTDSNEADLQTILYIIQDYVTKIKNIADSMID